MAGEELFSRKTSPAALLSSLCPPMPGSVPLSSRLLHWHYSPKGAANHGHAVQSQKTEARQTAAAANRTHV